MISTHNKTQNIFEKPARKYSHFFVLVFSLLVIISACNQKDAPPDERSTDQQNPPGKVVLSPQQIALAGFEFGKIEKKTLSGDIDARGKLILPNQNQASISPIIGGVVSSIKVSPGEVVKKGQVLAYLRHPDYINLQQKYLSATNSLEFLENDYIRQKRLFEENVTSEKKYLQAKTDYLETKSKAKSLELMIGQMGWDIKKIQEGKLYSQIPVSTPIEGVVDKIQASLGMNVSEDNLLFEVSCRKNLFVDLDVFEQDILKIEKGQRVSFMLSNVDTKQYNAKVFSIGGSVKRTGRVVSVLAKFENTGELLFPGMFVASKIHTGEEVFNALPESAIMNFGTASPFIFYTSSAVGSSTIVFEKTAIQTGFEEDGWVQVTLSTPIPADARILTKGGYYVQAEAGEE